MSLVRPVACHERHVLYLYFSPTFPNTSLLGLTLTTTVLGASITTLYTDPASPTLVTSRMY